jgi:hypothetical protein
MCAYLQMLKIFWDNKTISRDNKIRQSNVVYQEIPSLFRLCGLYPLKREEVKWTGNFLDLELGLESLITERVYLINCAIFRDNC